MAKCRNRIGKLFKAAHNKRTEALLLVFLATPAEPSNQNSFTLTPLKNVSIAALTALWVAAG